MSVLVVSQVSKEYGSGAARVQALKGVDVQVMAGEFLAIMGPSGCGKSTLLHVMGGIDAPTTGQIWLDGQDLSQLNDTARSEVRRRRIGFVFQKINLLPTLSAVENVALPLRIDGVSKAESHERAHAALERVAIAQRSGHFPHEMSGGEQQRVAIARALVIRPTVILADEPTGALDSVNAARILELLQECSRQGQTIVMVTHDPQMARSAARTIEMHDCRVVEHAESLADAAALAPRWDDRS